MDEKKGNELQDYFSYNPVTGEVSRIYTRGRGKLGVITTKNSTGYLCVNHKNKVYNLHRLAWFLYHGKWPENQLDHVNRDRTDNRIENLREATNRENSMNKESFRGGVYKNNKTGKWRAQIQINGKSIKLGTFTTKELAQQAYRDALP